MIDLHNESSRRWITAAWVGVALLSAAYWAEATLLRFRQGMPEANSRTAGNTGNAGPLANAGPAVSAPAVPSAEALARLLGAPSITSAAPLGPAERFKVLGVIAGASGRGTALVAVDGQTARTFSVGAELAPGFVLRSVSQKELTLAARPDGEVLATLPLPEPGSALSTSPGEDNTSAGRAGNPARATGAPPVLSGSRGNPRSVAPALPPAPLTPPNSAAPAPTPQAPRP